MTRGHAMDFERCCSHKEKEEKIRRRKIRRRRRRRGRRYVKWSSEQVQVG